MRKKALELTGQRFNRLLVIRKEEKRQAGTVIWRCLCDCGAEVLAQAYALKSGRVKSCGCWSRDRTRKHGMEGTPTYDVWAHMLDRCRNRRSKMYSRYGARGISVCDRWQSFENFLSDMGQKPDGLSLDRIDNNGNYEPGNCRWATDRMQNRNRSVSPVYEWKGEMRSLADLADEHGLKWRRVYERVRMGWSLEDALTIKRAHRWTRRNG